MTAALDQFVRSVDHAQLAVADKGDKPRLIGWAHRYGRLSQPLTINGKTFRERFTPGAFRRHISSPDTDLRALMNHDKNRPLGRQKAGTLTITESDEGVYFEVDPPDTSYARDLVESVRRRDVTGCSFRFSKPLKQSFTRENGEIVRTISEAGIHEVSIVTWPAYEDGSSVELRDIDPETAAQLQQAAAPTRLIAAMQRHRHATLI